MARWRTARRLRSTEELLAAAEVWWAAAPRGWSVPRAVYLAWLDQFRAWCVENDTTVLELLRMRTDAVLSELADGGVSQPPRGRD